MAKAVLLAEDSPDDEVLFKLVMRKAGIKNPVIVVRDGDEVIDYLKGEGRFADRQANPLPKVLFLDLKMPRLDGFAVLELLKAHPALREGLKIVVLTHFGDAKQISRAYELGADSFLSKPFTQEDWKSLIENFGNVWIKTDAEGGNGHRESGPAAAG